MTVGKYAIKFYILVIEHKLLLNVTILFYTASAPPAITYGFKLIISPLFRIIIPDYFEIVKNL